MFFKQYLKIFPFIYMFDDNSLYLDEINNMKYSGKQLREGIKIMTENSANNSNIWYFRKITQLHTNWRKPYYYLDFKMLMNLNFNYLKSTPPDQNPLECFNYGAKGILSCDLLFLTINY